MGETADTGGGGALFDRHLVDAYSELGWLRRALQEMVSANDQDPIPGFDRVEGRGGDPVMSVLQRMDWDQTSVEDTIAPLGKVASAASTAADDLHRLLNKADSAWDGEVFGMFRAVVDALEHDCTTFHKGIEQLRTDVDGYRKGVLGSIGLKHTVFEGLEKLTGKVHDFAKDLTAGYAWKLETCTDLRLDTATQEAMIKAFGELKAMVGHYVSQISDLHGDLKGHVAPLRYRSGTPQ